MKGFKSDQSNTRKANVPSNTLGLVFEHTDIKWKRPKEQHIAEQTRKYHKSN